MKKRKNSVNILAVLEKQSDFYIEEIRARYYDIS